MRTRPSFTIGIEEEFQVIDPETLELKSHIQELFNEGNLRLKEEMKRELHDPVIEIGTPICNNVQEAWREIARLRGEIIGLAARSGLGIASAGTHPFTDWCNVPITTGVEHYDRLIEDLQMIARANLIFGLHVHVAVEDNDARIAIMNAARYFLPHIFSLSTNSPFWLGQNTGWKSFRAKIFERFPRTGIPDYFASWSEYQEYVNTLIVTGCISDRKKIWWDVRAHPYFPTLEFRICDAQMRIDETICLAALFQAVTYKLWKLYDANQGWRIYRRSLINENKGRAARYGLDGKLIDLGKKIEVPTEALLIELLQFVDDVVVELGVRDEVNYVHELLRTRTGADRQLKVFAETGDLKAVVRYVMEELEWAPKLYNDVPLDLQTARFEMVRIEGASDLPPVDPKIIDVAVLDMNHGYANVGHDAIVALVRDATLALDEPLASDGRRVRVLSYAVRDRMMVPDHRSRRHRLYIGTGGPGHLDPRRNQNDRGTQEIREDPAWEPALWRLFDDVAADERSALYGVCHTFGLLCRWSNVAEPVLCGAGKGGPRSGVGTNVLTPQALAHPWFGRLAGASREGARVPVLDSRYYDLIPTSPSPPAGMTAIAHESAEGGKAGEALTMFEFARDGGVPRIFAVNHHPEIGSAERVSGLLERMLARGSITPEVYEERVALLPVLRNSQPVERLRVARCVFGDLIDRGLERLVRAA